MQLEKAGWYVNDPTIPESAFFCAYSVDVRGYEVKMPIKYFLLKNLSIDVTPYYTYWHINKSDVVVPPDYPIPLIEPDSNTHEEGLLGGLTYIF